MLYFCILLLAFVFWLLYEWLEHSMVLHKSTLVECQKIQEGETLKVCLITDLHNNKKNVTKIMEKVRGYSPHLILLAGDMVDKHKVLNKQALLLLQALSEVAPVYYSLGNHEETLRQEKAADWQVYLAGLPRNVILLDNKTMKTGLPGLKTKVAVSGLSLPESFYKKGRLYDREEELPVLNENEETEGIHILLAHNPEYAKWYGRYSADLVVSGHLHGGLLRLPLLGGMISPRLRKPKEDAGVYSYPYGKLFVSRGLGSHTIPLRFFNRAEINYITIKHGTSMQQNGEK